MADRIVHKFGGTSVLKEAPTMVKILLASLAAGEAPIAVVSALAGVTNLLEAVFADRHDPGRVEAHFLQVEELHRGWLRDLGLDEKLLDARLAAMREKFAAACRAHSLQEQRDAILALGEPLSAMGFAAYFDQSSGALGSAQDACVVDTSAAPGQALYAPLRLNRKFGSASPLDFASNVVLRETLQELTAGGQVPVVTGFIGRAGIGGRSRVATVGRGGSDLTACYLGGLLGAAEVRIWSDVPGMLTADPRVVGADEARPIPALPFRHAMEMAGGGGKLHPRALVYAARARVPVRMLSTFDVEAPGTRITHDCPRPSGLVGIVQLKATTILNFFSPEMSETEGFVAQVTGILARHGVVVGLISTGEVELTMTVTDPARRLDEALDEIREEMDIEPDVTRDISLITVVYACLGAVIEGRISVSLAACGVEAIALSRGASRLALQIPIAAADADRVVKALHRDLLTAV